MSVLPPLTGSFEWRTEAWGLGLACTALAGVSRHVFTTRQLDLGSPAGWRQAAASVGVEPHGIVTSRQVHGRAVLVVHDPGLEWPGVLGDADALISDNPIVALAVKAADCVPVLLADRRTGAVGAVHAGWRGTAVAVTVAALEAMRSTFGTRSEDVLAAIGPAIASCCYEVGSELVDEFVAAGHPRHLIDRWFVSPPLRRGESGQRPLRLDLPGANRDQLVLAGVPESHVHVSGLCTAGNLDLLTSYRAERANAGRLAAVIRPRVTRS